MQFRNYFSFLLKKFFVLGCIFFPYTKLKNGLDTNRALSARLRLMKVFVYLDISLKRFKTVYTAGGSLNSTVTLSLSELEQFALPAAWIDVCKGWNVNDLGDDRK